MEKYGECEMITARSVSPLTQIVVVPIPPNKLTIDKRGGSIVREFRLYENTQIHPTRSRENWLALFMVDRYSCASPPRALHA